MAFKGSDMKSAGTKMTGGAAGGLGRMEKSNFAAGQKKVMPASMKGKAK